METSSEPSLLTLDFFCAVVLCDLEEPALDTSREEYRDAAREELHTIMELAADCDRHFDVLFDKIWQAELEQQALDQQVLEPRRSWIPLKIRDWFR